MPIAMITFFANVLSPNIDAMPHLTAVLTITAMIIAIVAVFKASSLSDATESVIASTSANQEKNETK